MFRGMQHRWSVLLVFALVVAVVPAAVAGDLEPEPEATSLTLGDWKGWGWAGGTAVAVAGPVTFDWAASLDAEFDFSVSDDGPAGRWTLTGSGNNHIEGTFGGRFGTIDSALTYTGGGSVSGTNTVLLLDGEGHDTGTSILTSDGQSISFPVDNTSTIPTLEVKVTHALCEEVHGEWAYSIEERLEEHDFTASLDGTWFAVKNADAAQQALDQLLDDAAAGRSPSTNISELFSGISGMIATFQKMVDTWPNWDLDNVLQGVDNAERYIAHLRNLTECELRFFGADNVEQFMNGLSHMIQNLIIGATGVEGFDGEAFVQLVHVASRTGAVGPGALNPADALRAEEALIAAGERILAANVDPADGLIIVNDDTAAVMLGGALLGLTFDVPGSDNGAEGTKWNARDTYDSAMGPGEDEAPSS